MRPELADGEAKTTECFLCGFLLSLGSSVGLGCRAALAKMARLSFAEPAPAELWSRSVAPLRQRP